jgi:hypothetical protein
MYKTASSLSLACLLFVCTIGAFAQTVTTFEGIDASQLKNPEWLVDPNGAVGTKQYMEWVTPYYQAYDKVTFAPVWSTPQPGITPFVNNGVTSCNNFNGGDVIILFDRLASRWVLAAHTPAPNYYYCVAISNTDNLASTSLKWYTYAFPLNSFLGTNPEGVTYYPDWGKIATWPDAYYVGIDLGDESAGYIDVGVMACALDRTNMLIGGTPNTPQCFTVPDPIVGSPDYLAHSLEPADVEGTTPPPAGSPEYYVSIENPLNNGVAKTSNTLNLWQFHVNWTNPADTTFTQTSIPVPVFTPGCYNVSSPTNTICVPEPSTATTGQSIDSVGDRLMFRFAYRNFGEYESYLVSHAVQVNAGNRTQTGIRWYELRGSGAPSVYQSGTISPDTTTYRFLPSIAQDQNGNAAAGYSVSSSTVHPGISASWWSLTNQTAPTEISLYSGTGDEENVYHWGTYSSMTVDPVGGCAFWYVNQYFAQNQTGAEINFNTRISTFSLPGCGTATLSPTSLAFGVQSDGSTSPSQQIILSNSQSVALNISNITFGGANPGSFTQTNDCGGSVAAGETCSISVAFAPLGTSSGPFSATLVVNDDASNSPQSATLTGTGTSLPTLTVSTSAINFGNQAYGTSSASNAITVTNTGTSTVAFSSIAITGGGASSFPWSNNCPANLSGGAGCTIYVSFAPASSGNFSAAINLTSNAYGSPQSISLSGTGVVPLALSGTSLFFGTVLTGNTKAANPITLTNQSSVPVTGITFNVTGAAFSQVNTCGTALAAGAQCKVTVTFAPTTTGTIQGSVSITDSAANSPQAITLQGTAVQAVTITPIAGLAFGGVKVGTSSASKTLTVANNQTTALTIGNVGFTGAHPGDYSQTNTCGSSLAASSKCTVTVTFTPEATGSRSASFTLTDSANSSPQSVPLYGTGIAN